MIIIQSKEGELVRVIKEVTNTSYGFHKLFGFMTETNANERLKARKRNHFEFNQNEWLCQFNISESDNGIDLTNLKNCMVNKVKEGLELVTPNGEFILTKSAQAGVHLEDYADGKVDLTLEKRIAFVLSALFVAIGIYSLVTLENIEKEEEKEKVVEPITVKIIKQTQTVNIARQATKNIKVKPLTKKQASKRAVQRDLGFLGMIGSKDLSKVVGGAPQKLEKATAGAGKGGDAGSGGEVLTGLGKGLKKITVGNTGVTGLGGIGTKGAGGGKGGYGNTLVASGSGAGISEIAVSTNEMVLEGGISRYAINATIAKYLNQVRRCYEAQLKYNPNLQGIVQMSFEINPKGRLNYSKVSKTTLNNKKTEDCISSKMMGWQFPRPKGNVNQRVKYPFNLRPVGNL